MSRLTNAGIPLDQIRTRVNPLTGKTLAYVQTHAISVIDHQIGNIFDPELFKQELTNELVGQTGADAYCDSVDYVQGSMSDTVYPSVWIAVDMSSRGELVAVDAYGNSLGPWLLIAYALYAILMTKAFWVLCSLLVVYYILTLVYRQDTFLGTDANGNPQEMTRTQYISSQNNKYWYVCGKDYFGIGEKSIYATPQDVPADQIALFNEHCTNAPDLNPQFWNNLTTQIVIAVAAIGGIYIAVKVLPSFLSKKAKT